MKVGIPKEIYPHERRVAATPDTVEKMVKAGLEVVVEAGAGEVASFADALYIEAGAHIKDAAAVFAESDIVLKVRQPMARPAGGRSGPCRLCRCGWSCRTSSRCLRCAQG
jgi:NAD(P) transhydrogenase subunit alpha